MKEQSLHYEHSKPTDSILHRIPEKWRIRIAGALVIGGASLALHTMQDFNQNTTVSTEYNGPLGQTNR